MLDTENMKTALFTRPTAKNKRLGPLILPCPGCCVWVPLLQYGAESWPAILFLSSVAVVFLTPAVLLYLQV